MEPFVDPRGKSSWRRFKRFLIGVPIASAHAAHQRLSRVKALAVLSSDALSSVAYATEESLLTLSVAGSAAFAANIPIALTIAALLLIVTISYRQTIFAYPSGGGAYIVASDNLGRTAGLTAAAALLIDYVLTVAVSMSSGIAAVTSALPILAPYKVALSLTCILLITVINLRGVRESGSIFTAPTYLFVASLLTVLGIGAVRLWFLHDVTVSAAPAQAGSASLGLFLLLRAFASGCSAMTGVEAISNGVPVFEPPEATHAAQTMTVMSTILGVMFLSITFLTQGYGLAPRPDETLLSQLAHQVLGGSWFYYVLQGSTLLVLVLAANTSYADFPRLASILAKDGFIPRQFSFRGDRLAFSTGIIVLALCSAFVLVLFHADTTSLIPLYAIGVFISFTLSQAGMVRHWYKRKGRHWLPKVAVNGLGAVSTMIVACVAGITKFTSGEPLVNLFGFEVRAGAWIVIVLIPLHIMVFQAIHRHYRRARTAATAEIPTTPEAIRHRIIVPVAGLQPTMLQSLAYGASMHGHVTAVHVGEDQEGLRVFAKEWASKAATLPFLKDIKLELIETPYRSLVEPVLNFVSATNKAYADSTITVVLSEMVPAHFWEQFLHNHVALRLKAALLFKPGIVVVSVPYHLLDKPRSHTKHHRT